MSATETAKQQQRTIKLASPLIDTDVHELMRSSEELLPYMQPQWHKMIAGDYYSGGGLNSLFYFPYHVPQTWNGARADWTLPDGTVGTDLDALRRHLFDEEGVSIAILNGFLHVSASPTDFELVTAVASAYNDWQIENWLDKEPRLRGSVHVVAHQPELAAKEIDRIAAHPQIVQVFLPLVTDRQYGDPMYLPIFEAARRNDLAVAFHHGPETLTVLGLPRYYIEWHTNAPPHAAANQLTSLICNGLFDRLPDLRVVFLETGVAWLPWLMWRLDQQYRELRSNVPWVKRLPSEHIRDCVRISTQPWSDVTPRRFAQLVEMIDAANIFMFSSDYPHYDADSGHLTEASGLPMELRERIRYKNAADAYARLNI